MSRGIVVSLTAELKRRNVFRVATAYLALGWVVTEVTGTVVPLLNLPTALPTIVLWIGLIGFPFVVAFSWAYELTPEGLKRESEVDRSQSITGETGKRLDYVIFAMLALSMLLFVVRWLAPGTGSAPEPVVAAGHARDTTAAASAELAEDSRGHGPLPQQEAAQVPNDKSIAVLPFVNMSSDPEQEYFSDGISEELLNLLAEIPELRVIARTSSFAFKGEKHEIPEIARRLQVANILEGSVRKSGNKVRITAQLVRASDSTHLWSETYDRSLDDIFAVQDEIAGHVVAQLKLALLGPAPKSVKVDPQAYALTLQARKTADLGTNPALEQSIATYQKALELEPDYPPALTGLARAYMDGFATDLRPGSELMRLAREAAERALAADPENPVPHVLLAELAMSQRNVAATVQGYRRALELDPDNFEALSLAARTLRSLGRLEQAIALGEFRVARDPINSIAHLSLGNSYSVAGRYDDALAEGRTALALSAATVGARYSVAQALLGKGDPEAALHELEQADTGDVWRAIGLPIVYHALGRTAESDAALAQVIAGHERDWAFNIAGVLAFRGETDRAFEWLDKAVEYRDAGLRDLAIEPLLKNLRQDPRWLPFLRSQGMAPEQLAAIPFEIGLPR